ncbi:MAG: YHS domain-containing (seleno)protein [Cyclobacteriaceae bacterium]
MKLKISLLALAVALLTAPALQAQQTASRVNNYNIKKSLALEGYDPVSYFSNKPVEGKSELKYEYNGVIYQFANQANLSKFKANPQKFEPAYGGWCAYAMGATGEKVKVDPETFKVVDGALYLFYNFWGNNTLTDWNKDEKVLKSKADQNWKKIVQ